MPARSSDTTPEAERVQLDLLRAASPERRLRLALSLSRSVMELAPERLERSDPDASPDEIGIRFVETLYGAHLAAAVRADLAARRQ